MASGRRFWGGVKSAGLAKVFGTKQGNPVKLGRAREA